MFRSRKINLVLIFIMLLMFTTACSTSGEQGGKVEDQNAIATDISDDKGSDTESKEESSKEQELVEEQVLLDQDDIKITLKSLSFDGIFGPSLKILVENNSSKAFTVQIRDSSINDVMVGAMFSCDVASGKKANDSITFMSSDLELAEITTIQNIEFKFHVFDSDTWDGILDSDIISVTTKSDPSYAQSYDDSGVVVVDENGFKIVMKRVSSTDSFWGADVHVYIENNSDVNATIQTRDVSINGFMISPIFSSDVMAGKKAYDTITFFESDLEDNDITIIENMELSFHIFGSDSWDTIFDTDMIEVTFE